MQYRQMTPEQLEAEYARVKAAYDGLAAKGLSLNLARGKPAAEQLDLSNELFHTLDDGDFVCDGVDVRNYGCLDGLPACKRLFAEILGVEEREVLVGGNASLNLMYDLIAKAYTHGLLHSPRPWSQEPVVKFLCPAPGYDRHFHLSQSFGMELITVPLHEEGPDMDVVERLALDPAVKGMWCVPKYSNPDGFVYSEEVCRRIASMRTGAPDFALMWDNAYCIHEFDGPFVPFVEMLSLCREMGNPDRVYEFASTSKVTFAGAGVACMAASAENLAHVVGLLTFQTIGYDKVNQLMHVRFLKDKAHTLAHMQRHAAILKPKFEAVLRTLDNLVAPTGTATWHRPHGGYFISLNAMPGTAKRTLALCKQAGVVMTGAGATYPYGKDPEDSNIRIAPSYPTLPELEQAAEVFCTSLCLAALEKLLGR
jgi:DNA-binding transcriptional MocR family regulator